MISNIIEREGFNSSSFRNMLSRALLVVSNYMFRNYCTYGSRNRYIQLDNIYEIIAYKEFKYGD